MHQRRGFTLIELLIVVAIIAILAAIAIPNFLHAQMRARIARVQADFASVAVAMESFRTDHADYPLAYGGAYFREMAQSTTPIKYMTSIPLDPFKPWDVCPDSKDHDGKCFNVGDTRLVDGGGYDMIRCNSSTSPLANLLFWFMLGVGPDSDEERGYWDMVPGSALWNQLSGFTYDISNGLMSSGDLYRFGPTDPRPRIRQP